MSLVFVSHPTSKLAQYFGDRALQALRALAGLRLNTQDRELTTHELIDAAADCDVLIAYRQTEGPRALFQALPRLVAFVRCAVDIRTVDVPAASAGGVLVTQASAGYVPAVSEWIIAVMVDLARGISRYADAYHRDAPLAPFMGRQLKGSTLGIIGYGQIGQYLADVALAMGMRVLVTTPRAIAQRPGLEAVPLAQLLAGSDFVACLAPANSQTANMMNAEVFAAMRPGAFFINASRGELVDETALLHALESGHLGGCALDVGRAADQMPTPALARHPLVLAAPHIGGLTTPAIEHQALETVQQTALILRGEVPAGAVNGADATRLRRFVGAGSAA